MLTTQTIADPEFWHQPLADRMAQFAVLREQGPFLRVTVPDPLTISDEDFFAVTRYAEVVEISKRPADFCSGRGSTAIVDLPTEAMEFFGSFIVMDDPRHARQRGIVARSFTPRQLAGVLDSVERVCTEVVDGICEKGEVDLVETVSQPFPLLIICDMMGIPRSEFTTVLNATNVILGAGDPEMVGTDNPEEILGALIGAGMELANLMNDLAEARRKNPTDDLTSALVHNTLGEEVLAPNELAPFFILLAVAGNDTTRTGISHGMNLLTQNPGERAKWQADVEGAAPKAVEEIVRAASPSCGARPPGRCHCRGRTSRRATSSCCSTARPTVTRASSTTPRPSTSAGTPIRTWVSAVRVRISASVPTWPGASCR